MKKIINIEEFKNIYSFINTIEKREVNSVFKQREVNLSSEREKTTSHFYNCKNYNEASKMLKNGYVKTVEKFKFELKDFEKKLIYKKNTIYKSVNGFAPIVPNAINGIPKSMYNMKHIDANKKTIHIIYSPCCACRESESDIVRGGIEFLKLCTLLNSKNIKVKISIVPIFATEEDKYKEISEFSGCIVDIKNYNQPFNLLKMSYPLSNTDFFRRHGFKYLETVPNLKLNKFSSCYGKALQNTKELKEILIQNNSKYKECLILSYYDFKNNDFNIVKVLKSKNLSL